MFLISLHDINNFEVRFYDFVSNAVQTKVPVQGEALIPTDLSISIPESAYTRIAPWSVLAYKHLIEVGAAYPDPILRAKNKSISTFDDMLKKIADVMFDIRRKFIFFTQFYSIILHFNGCYDHY